MQILGVSATRPASTELMMQTWISTGLGFALNQIEEAFGVTFNLWGQPDEYVEFNTSALLRSAYKDRIDGLSKAVLGGILSPNEARNEEGYDSVPFGDEPRVQQQVVPLSAASAIKPTGPGKPTDGTQVPAAPPAPTAAAQPAPKELVGDVSRSLLSSADEFDRNSI